MGHIAIAAIAAGPASAAIAKVTLWLIGLYYALHFRRVLFSMAAIISAASSVVRGLTDSGAHISTELSQSVVYWSTPGIALIVGAFIVARYNPIWVGHGWRL